MQICLQQKRKPEVVMGFKDDVKYLIDNSIQ